VAAVPGWPGDGASAGAARGRRLGWLGWRGEGIPASVPSVPLELRPITLTPSQVREYYHGFSNATMWPLLHNAVEKPRFERRWWDSYQTVNRRFAENAAEALDARPHAVAWVHDYQLTLVPSLLRERAAETPIGFFLHVPWPSPDLFARLPWRREVLLGLLGADVVSFHTERYRGNFLRTIRRLLIEDGVEVRGTTVIAPDGREVTTTAAPISIDVGEFTRQARSAAADREVRAIEQQFAGRALLLGVDRLDYTKGIVERLLAFEMLLHRRPDLRTKLPLLQVAVPTRDDVPAYRELRATVEGIIGRINGRFTQPGRDVPVHYLYRSLDHEQLTGYYAAADTLLVTPLIDGMNLVAKEYVVVQQARRSAGALVLSEFTGAAAELRNAVLCNPFDVEGLSVRIEQALAMPADVRRAALRTMSRRVRANDVHRWIASQLNAITAAHRRGGRGQSS
jgi:alpha,alpha-trehalose-phosphate synthase [UDP-forming]